MNLSNPANRLYRTVTLLGLSLLALVPATQSHAQSARQKDKNLMRNLGIGLGGVAVHKAVTGKPKEALVYGAAAAYAGKKYEDRRKEQRTWRSYRTKNGKRVGYWLMRGKQRVRYVALR
jgi:hypothetical protein